MKTSLNELRLAEDYLFGQSTGEERTLMEARLLLEPAMRDDLYWQQETYVLVRTYGRQQLRRDIERVHCILFTAPKHRPFKEKIFSFFRK